MKKKILCLAMIALMVIGTPLTANAEHFEGSKNWNVTFDGKNLSDNFTNGDVTETILSKLQPGDSVTLQINMKNTDSKKSDWYLTNEVLKTLEETAAGGNAAGGAYTYLLTYHDPAKKETVLFDSERVGGEEDVEKEKSEIGLHEATDNLDEWVYLDRLNSGESAYVTLYVKLDGETQGNAYQESVAQLKMNFAVEKVNDATITKKKVVEGEEKVETVVVTKYVPSMVKTGDNSQLVLFSTLTLVSGLGLFVFATYLMKKRRKGEE